MEISNIKPFVKFSRFLEFDNNSAFIKVRPIDARLFFCGKRCRKNKN